MPSKTIVAIISITVLLITSLLLGINGAALAGGIAIIAGLGGFAAAKKKQS